MNIYNFFIGVDGCQKGWISISINSRKNWEIEIFSSIIELWNKYFNAKLILIDIPIGLRDKGETPRLCDIAARKHLTRKRSSSIFPPPCRSVLSIDSYPLANQINRTLTGKGLSKQAWNIKAKIKDVDDFLQNNPKARQVFIESHPELCFMALAKRKPLDFYKKTKQGINERINLLNSYFEASTSILKEGLQKFEKNDVAVDDILDSLVLALSASQGINNLNFIPENYEHDSTGLPMRMAVPLFE